MTWLRRLLNSIRGETARGRPIRSGKDGEELTEWELEELRSGRCPDCGRKGFLAGPEGGLSQNFRCGSPGCGSRFNSLMRGVERISDASPDRAPDPAPPKVQAYR